MIADPEPDPDPTTHFSPDLDPPILQNDPLRLPPFHFDANANADPDPAFHFDADPNPDLQHWRTYLDNCVWEAHPTTKTLCEYFGNPRHVKSAPTVLCKRTQ
jgi:hypothetical protein